jgi:hypothetical protein
MSHRDPTRPLLPLYYFSVKSDLMVLSARRSDASGPRGTRIHVTYGGDSVVTTDAGYYQKSWGHALLPGCKDPAQITDENENHWRRRGWNGIEGKVLSGADFLLARLDGVLEFDGRVTIRAKDETLIDATYWALVDLERDWDDPSMRTEAPLAVPTTEGPQEAAASPGYLKFVAGKLSGKLRVNLCVHFETNTGPWASSPEAQDSAWTKKSRLKHERNVWKYRQLVRRQFYGTGTITIELDTDRLPSPKRIDIDVLAPPTDWKPQ